MKLTAEQQIKNSIKSYRDLLNHIGKEVTRVSSELQEIVKTLKEVK